MGEEIRCAVQIEREKRGVGEGGCCEEGRAREGHENEDEVLGETESCGMQFGGDKRGRSVSESCEGRTCGV